MHDDNDNEVVEPPRRVSFSTKIPKRHVYDTPKEEDVNENGSSSIHIGFYKRAFRWCLRMTLMWHILVVILLVATPPIAHSVLIYLHVIRVPFFMDFTHPESVGLMSTRHFFIETDDGMKLGAWHTLPAERAVDLYADDSGLKPNDTVFDKSLLEDGRRVVLYFHGNMGSRAVEHRVNLYKLLSGHFGSHVISFDYRGFADSTGWPDEDGVARDARAAWRWLTEEKLVPKDRIIIYGHSLGTAISSRLVHDLSLKDSAPAGLVLEAPFVNLEHAALMHPSTLLVRIVPFATSLLRWALVEKFSTIDALPYVTCPVLIMHGTNDNVIVFEQSEMLLDRVKDQSESSDRYHFHRFDGALHNSIHRHRDVLGVLQKFFTYIE